VQQRLDRFEAHALVDVFEVLDQQLGNRGVAVLAHKVDQLGLLAGVADVAVVVLLAQLPQRLAQLIALGDLLQHLERPGEGVALAHVAAQLRHDLGPQRDQLVVDPLFLLLVLDGLVVDEAKSPQQTHHRFGAAIIAEQL
jgi:hypothetical protein